MTPKCERCNGKGAVVQDDWYQYCDKCYATGHKWRWLVKFNLWFWRAFNPRLLPEWGQYDQWDEMLWPPKPWTCRACNGWGYDPYTWPCEACEETGLKWRWIKPVLDAVGLLRWPIRKWQDWQYDRRANKPLSEDEIPF